MFAVKNPVVALSASLVAISDAARFQLVVLRAVMPPPVVLHAGADLAGKSTVRQLLIHVLPVGRARPAFTWETFRLPSIQVGDLV